MRTPRRPFLFLLEAAATLLLLATSATAEYVAKYPFLYASESDKNASFPVIEHLSPEFRGLDKDSDDRPDFLYAPDNQSYRIVEFYIHWCNTCKLFKTVYRNFSLKIKELAEKQGIHVDVYAVSCSPNRKLCVDQALKGFPKIRLYKPGETAFFELVHHTHLHPLSVLEELGIDFDRQDEAEDDWDIESAMAVSREDTAAAVAAAQPPTVWQRMVAYITTGGPIPDAPKTTDQQEQQTYYRRTRNDLKADIHLSFDYALRNEVYTSSAALTPEQQRVLRQWLELLSHTLPSSWELNKLIKELIDNFMYVAKSEDYLVALLDEYPAPMERWSFACSHGSADDGYTCGLWELFHAMTVGFVDYNKAAFDPSKILVTESAARTLRDYVDNFFGCETCRQNFVAMFDSCAHERCDRLSNYAIDDENEWIELPLWLYTTHNSVNVRLMKEKAGREHRDVPEDDVLRVQWPPRRECGACWRENDDDDDGTVTWKSDMVYKFLRLEYGQRDAFTADLRRELMPEQVAVVAQITTVTDRNENVSETMAGSPLLIQLSHATVFVLSIVVLNLSGKVQRRRKVRVA